MQRLCVAVGTVTLALARPALAQSEPEPVADTTPVAPTAQSAGYGAPATPSAPPATYAPVPNAWGAPSYAPVRADCVEREATRWYGWQTLIVDALAFGAFAVAAVDDEDELAFASFVTYALVPSGIHVTHRGPLVGLASAGIRVGFPIVTTLVVAGVSQCGAGGDWCDRNELLGGVAAGMLAAIVLDAALLANEHVAPQAAASRHLTVQPVVGISLRRPVVGIQGTF